jgi:hypothetical protein
VDGLWESVRAAEGKKGGVCNIGLISSAINLPGDAINGNRANWWGTQGIEPSRPPTEMTDKVCLKSKRTFNRLAVHFKGEVMIVVGYKPLMFSDMSDSDAEYWESTLKPQAMDAMATPTPKMKVEEWKVSYLLTENDPAMPIGFQEYLIERARTARAQIEVMRIYSGHFVMITHAREVAEWVKKQAGVD